MAGNTQVSVAPMTQADMNELMTGSAHGGAPTAQEAWGIQGGMPGSAPLAPKSQAELEIEAQLAFNRAVNPQDPIQQVTLQQPQPSYDDISSIRRELDQFKKLYGQSENEKGEMRRALNDQMEAFNALMGQYQQMGQAQPQSQVPFGTPTYGPQQSYGYSGGPTKSPFDDFNDASVPDGATIKRAFKEWEQNTVAPAFTAVYQAAMTAAQRAQALETQLIAQSKINAGITPTDEFRLEQRNPWLRNIPAPNKIAAMTSILKQERAAQQWTGLSGSEQQAQIQQMNAPQATRSPGAQVVRQVTHVESTPSSAPDLTYDALAAAQARDLQAAQALPDWDDATRKSPRAEAMRAYSAKYGMGWGTGGQVIGR